MFFKKFLLLALALPSVLIEAQRMTLADDTDISGAEGPSVFSISNQLEWDELIEEPISSGAELLVLRRVGEELRPVEGLRFTRLTTQQSFVTDAQGRIRLSLCMDGDIIELRAELKEENYFQIQNDSDLYSLKVRVDCRQRVTGILKEDTAAGQALGIWQVAYQAKTRLRDTVGLDFWTFPLSFHFPASGDYYSHNGNLHISRGDHWDVVAHEMGHAIYDLANIGAWGGGQHYIDRCYSFAMALSEGWASYFASFVMNDRSDPDAKFEFMVPRRAPIQIENVPEDVCREPTNEWRVTSFLWDLYDLNTDDETADFVFAEVWSQTLNGGFASVVKLKEKLLESKLDETLVEAAWQKNFGPTP